MNSPQILKEEKGATAVMVAILLVVLVGFCALAVDIGYLFGARNELQNVADASALAAARKLGAIYQGQTLSEQLNYVCSESDKQEIIEVGKEVADTNTAAGEAVYLRDNDVIIGQWLEWRDLAPGSAKPENLNQPDAVHVIARRDDNAENGPITTYFARVLGISTVEVTASATAALSGMSSADPGEIELPVGISRAWFQGDYCEDEIRFYPADSCAGWTGFDANPNVPRMRDILDERVESPEVIIGETEFQFTGGVAANLFNNMQDLFNRKAIWVDENGSPTTEGNGQLVWPTNVVVYGNPDDSPGNCSNPNQSYPVVGFARVIITEVLTSPTNSLRGVVTCNFIDQENSRGGGEYFGLKGPIPSLVQ